MNLRNEHIPFEKLADMARRSGEAEADQTILAHMDACAACREQFERLEQGIELMQTDSSTDAPRDAQSNVKRLFTPREPDSLANAITRRVKAALSFDSRQLSPAFGVRSGRSVARQMLYNVGEHDLDIRITPDDGAWVVSGQVLGDCTDGAVSIEGSDVTEQTQLNELCEFTLPRVPAGSYTLLILVSGIEIEVPEFELKA